MANKLSHLVCLLLFGYCLLLAAPKQVSAASPQDTKFGIYYLMWTCLATTNVYDNEKILAGQGTWGPLGSLHWWGEPAEGYYCITNRPDIIRKHAEQLRDAKIDFIFVDFSNYPGTDQFYAKDAALDPFPKLLATWSQVPGAPKIVPWVNYSPGGDMVDWVVSKMSAYPDLAFKYQNKPLFLLVDNQYANVKEPDLIARGYTVRRMWALDLPQWSYEQKCQNEAAFRASQGTIPCNQALSNQGEQLSVNPAYQTDYMSNAQTAVPKYDGRTFRRQFDTVMNNPGVPIVTITSWNEWIAQRFCFDDNFRAQDTNCTHESFADGSRVFIDQYNPEYNRDIEPSKNGKKDYYYELMKSCISVYKSGQSCQNNNTALCCKDYTDNWKSTIAPPRNKADISGPNGTPDNAVDAYDYTPIVTDYGKLGDPGFSVADISGDKGIPDGTVSMYDYSFFVSNFGK